MSQIEKLIQSILRAKADIPFADLEKILLHVGYRKTRQKGSHVHFRKEDATPLTLPVHHGKVKIVYVKHIIKLLAL